MSKRPSDDGVMRLAKGIVKRLLPRATWDETVDLADTMRASVEGWLHDRAQVQRDLGECTDTAPADARGERETS